ncbi:MAG: ankyrin repeat domain-containing protein, partial [Deltaproteobacteria bacterium]|nr:ankyrin repeat domain-containing protein [Deltaproteobacteria bacterium]
KNGVTVLMWAARNNANPEVVKVLLAGGADVRDMDDDGRNAIWHARHNKTDNREKIIQILEGY